jgi:hypothetical protein
MQRVTQNAHNGLALCLDREAVASCTALFNLVTRGALAVWHEGAQRTDAGSWARAFPRKRHELVAVSLPKRFRDGRFNSETATWIRKWFKISAGTSRKVQVQQFF